MTIFNVPVLYYAIGSLLVVLVLASMITAVKVHRHPERNYTELKLRIKTWWLIIGVFCAAIAIHPLVGVVILGLVSFLAFKEFISLVPTRRSDYRVLLWAFLAIPLQYYWIGTGWYGMFIIFIPVYVFLFLPMRMVTIGETKGFVHAAGTLHWGLMTTVFSLSHLAYLLVLPAKTGERLITGEMLLFFVVALTQFNDVAQYVWGKTFGKIKIIPKVSPNKTLAGLLGGIATTTVLAYFVAPWLTPFTDLQAVLVGLLLGITGFIGDVVMSAVKRDMGVKDASQMLPGHGGILDRLDSLTFTAPLFFHFTYYLHY